MQKHRYLRRSQKREVFTTSLSPVKQRGKRKVEGDVVEGDVVEGDVVVEGKTSWRGRDVVAVDVVE